MKPGSLLSRLKTKIYSNNKRAWKKTVNVLACITVFCTTYALILPAVTETTETYCGKEEHTHEDSCYKEVLDCSVTTTQGHTHTDSCYETETDENGITTHVLICGKTESAPVTHDHSSSCYKKELVCGKEEHTHSLICYSNPEADLETAASIEASLPKRLTGIEEEDIILVAKSQEGYKESIKNYTVEGTSTIKGYTRYGYWYGGDHEYLDWSGMFISFVLSNAGINDKTLPETDDVTEWTYKLSEKDNYLSTEDGEYQAGDILIVKEKDENSNEAVLAGVITKVDEDKNIEAIIGDLDNQVKANTYPYNSTKILGYARIPSHQSKSESTGDKTEGTEESSDDNSEDGDSDDDGEDDQKKSADKSKGSNQETEEPENNKETSETADDKTVNETLAEISTESKQITAKFSTKARMVFGGRNTVGTPIIDNWVNSIKFEKGEGTGWANADRNDEGTVVYTTGSKAKFTFSFNFPAYSISSTSDVFSFYLPDGFTLSQPLENVPIVIHDDTTGEDVTYAYFDVDNETGLVTIYNFSQKYVDANNGTGSYAGNEAQSIPINIAIEGNISCGDSRTPVTYTFPGSGNTIIIQPNIPDGNGDINTEKTGTLNSSENKIHYTVKTSSYWSTNGEKVTITDTLSSDTVQSMQYTNVKIYRASTTDEEGTKTQLNIGYTLGTNSITFNNLDDLSYDEEYILEYDVVYDPNQIDSENGYAVITNTASSTTLTFESTTTPVNTDVHSKVIEKSAETYNEEENTIEWTVTIYGDVTDYVFSDSIQEGMEYVDGSAAVTFEWQTIENITGLTTTKSSLNLDFNSLLSTGTFQNGQPLRSGTYRIKYKTTITDRSKITNDTVSNTATVTDTPDNKTYSATATQKVTQRGWGLEKKVSSKSIKLMEIDGEERKIAVTVWEVNITLPVSGLEQFDFNDVLTLTNNYDWLNVDGLVLEPYTTKEQIENALDNITIERV